MITEKEKHDLAKSLALDFPLTLQQTTEIVERLFEEKVLAIRHTARLLCELYVCTRLSPFTILTILEEKNNDL